MNGYRKNIYFKNKSFSSRKDFRLSTNISLVFKREEDPYYVIVRQLKEIISRVNEVKVGK